MIRITDTVEHEDGSATYTFDLDDEVSKQLTSLGLEFALTCTAYELSTQDAFDIIHKSQKERYDNDTD